MDLDELFDSSIAKEQVLTSMGVFVSGEMPFKTGSDTDD